MSFVKADVRVLASGFPMSQLLIRTKLIAAAVNTCWRWVLTVP